MVGKESCLVSGSVNSVFVLSCLNVYSNNNSVNKIGFFLLTSNKLVSSSSPFLSKKNNNSFYISSNFFFNNPNHCSFSCYNNTGVLLNNRLYVLGSVTLGPISNSIRRNNLAASFNYKL